jgi:hypothetical protein
MRHVGLACSRALIELIKALQEDAYEAMRHAAFRGLPVEPFDRA